MSFSIPSGTNRDLLSVNKGRDMDNTIKLVLSSTSTTTNISVIMLYYGIDPNSYPITILIGADTSGQADSEFDLVTLLAAKDIDIADGYYYAYSFKLDVKEVDQAIIDNNDGYFVDVDLNLRYNYEVITDLENTNLTLQNFIDEGLGYEFWGGVEFVVYDNLLKTIYKEVATKAAISKCLDNCPILYKLNTVKFLELKKSFQTAHTILNS